MKVKKEMPSGSAGDGAFSVNGRKALSGVFIEAEKQQIEKYAKNENKFRPALL